MRLSYSFLSKSDIKYCLLSKWLLFNSRQYFLIFICCLKRENGRFFTVRSFILPKKYRPRPHFPLTETIVSLPPETTVNLSSQPSSSSFSFYHSLSRQFEALSPGKAGLLKLRQSYGSSVIKGIELSCPKGLLTKYQTVCP